MQAAGFLQVAGSLFQGIAGASAARKNARRAERQAAEERRASAAEIRRFKDQARAQIGEQLAAQVGNGLEGGSGTALDSLRQSQINAALDVMEIRRQGSTRARSLEDRADDLRDEAKFSLLSGVLGAGSSHLTTRADWAQERALGGYHG